jgi:hypothetical protein
MIGEERGMRNYAVVHPEGYRELRASGRVPDVGTVLSIGIVSYVSCRDKQDPTVYLDPATPKPQQVVMFVVDDTEHMLSLGEAAHLADQLRRIGDGSIGPPTTAAIGIERTIAEVAGREPASEFGSTDFFDSEKAAMQTAIEVWLMEVGVAGVPKRVLGLLNALREEAQEPSPDDPSSAA